MDENLEPEIISTTVAWPSADWRPLEVQVRWQLLKGRWECVGLGISFPEGRSRPLKTADLRGLTLGSLLQKAAAVLPQQPGDHRNQKDTQQPLTSRGRVDGKTLLEVVRIYKEAQTNGQPPTKAVQEHFSVTKERAARWVWLCRNKYHLLPPTRQGTSGGGDPFDPDYARLVLSRAGHSEEDISRIMAHFPRWIEPELLEALRAAGARKKGRKEGK